ncbi:hypothetical protein V2G26_020686 [Clonostachys chloroleuca]
MLLDAGVNPHVEDAQRNNPLHILGARLAGHEANAFALDADGNTLLHTVAATIGSLQNGEAGEIMVQRFQWLIGQGLDIMAENSLFQKCLDVAMVNENQAILKLFERNKEEPI